jgi:1,4-dihydroxy-6-naphthoate synthase
MKLTLGFSPCPNDTFIFDALVNKKIDTPGLEFEEILEDVETLNQWAYGEKLDITKLSFPSFFSNANKYILLNSGAALGKGVGPILISKKENVTTDEVNNSLIALPGENTTANFLFSFAYPEAKNKVFMRFDKIEDFVLNESSKVSPVGGDLEGALGVIIHENRFTYQQKELKKIKDLGEYWEEKVNMPIPLGGIAIKRSVDDQIISKVDTLIKKSIEYAFSKYPLIPDFVKIYSQEMSEKVMRQHIELYVNDYSIDLGIDGKKSITKLFEVYNTHNSSGKVHISGSDLFFS